MLPLLRRFLVSFEGGFQNSFTKTWINTKQPRRHTHQHQPPPQGQSQQKQQQPQGQPQKQQQPQQQQKQPQGQPQPQQQQKPPQGQPQPQQQQKQPQEQPQQQQKQPQEQQKQEPHQQQQKQPQEQQKQELQHEININKIIKHATQNFKKAWENEAQNGYQGVIFPVVLTSCFIVYYVNNFFKILKLKEEIKTLKSTSQNTSKQSLLLSSLPEIEPTTTDTISTSQQPTGTSTTVVDGIHSESEKQIRKQRRILFKQIKDTMDQNIGQLSTHLGGKVDETLLKSEIHKLLVDTELKLNTTTTTLPSQKPTAVNTNQ